MNHKLPQTPLSDSQYQRLDQTGCLVLPSAISAGLLSALRERIDTLFIQEGESAGSEFKKEAGCRRLANLINKGDVFQQVVTHPLMLSAVAHVLRDDFKLSSLNARTADPRNGQRQPLHCDMGAVPDDRGYWVCNAIWMLDDFTASNGATRFVPGSHRLGTLPQEHLTSLTDDHPEQQLVTAPAGSIAIMNAHLWHGGLANDTHQPRRAVHVFFARRDKPQQQYQKQLLSEEVQSGLNAQLRQLLALDDEQNDRLSAQVTQRSGFLMD